MKSQYSIGIIGAGMHGKVLMRSLQADKRARLTWVSSATQASTEAAAAEFSIPRKTQDYREMLADPALDAVVIATPPHQHCTQLVDALCAGKHVLVEKPLTISGARIGELRAASEARPELVVLEASCRHTRLQPKFDFVRSLIRDGKLGRVYHIHHAHLCRSTFIEYNSKGAWAMDKSLAGGGPFIDWGVYDLSFHLGLLDDSPVLKDLRSFTARGLRDLSHLVPFTDVEQHGAAWLEFDGGLTYYYERGAGVHGETVCETRIHGTKGGLRLQYPTWESCQVEYFYDDGELRRESMSVDMSKAPDDNVALIRHFLDCLDGTAQPIMPLTLAARNLEILFRILDQPK